MQLHSRRRPQDALSLRFPHCRPIFPRLSDPGPGLAPYPMRLRSHRRPQDTLRSLHRRPLRMGDQGPGLAPCPVQRPFRQHPQDITSLSRRTTATKLFPSLHCQRGSHRRKMHPLRIIAINARTQHPHVQRLIFLGCRLPPRRVFFLKVIPELFLALMDLRTQSRMLDESERLVMARTSDCSVPRSYRYRTPRTLP